ncbi:hypothetical protein CAPTEDRAFT_227505 [Capitella teleta]|uniref:Uncharacterized protein n=1 Tax=Capitella teleta TaxID=283909 RepID=R7UHW6_CAPTE|nr:hypothetical protein CAPTEDRAFT_227505 [Capitella teleta]|eukprot:ELU06129.1 hypothetical protein CAPTEDRAFT_227505 [Capitella teleta]
MRSTLSIAATSTLLPVITPQSTTIEPINTATDIDLLSILVVIAIFVLCILVCTVLGCRSSKGSGQGDRTGSSGLGEEGLSLADSNGVDLRENPGYADSELAAPDTPPPTYSMIERQTSYVSHISQTSSMCSVPPEYDEATELSDADHNANRTRSSRAVRSSSSGRSSGRRNRSAGRNNSLQALRARFQGRRSHSAVESRARGGSSSVTSDAGIPEVVNDNVEVPEVFEDDERTAGAEDSPASDSVIVIHPPSDAEAAQENPAHQPSAPS